MKLVDLLVQELPKWGGWPKGVDAVEQDSEGQLFEMDSDYCSDFQLEKCDDWISDVVTRQQYESALAASKAVVGHDEWIQWAGGEYPVDSDAIVEVKYRKPNPYQYNNDRAGDFYWAHTGSNGDIIAYRLHQQTKSEQARAEAWRSYAGMTENDDEPDLNECIGQDVDITEWNGEGLPPVGLICEGRFPRHPGISFEWQECLVLYVFERECAVKSKSTSTLHYCDEFRPLRTEAEKAREDAETAMITCLAGTGAGITPLDAKGIYDAIAAGKIPGIKLEGK